MKYKIHQFDIRMTRDKQKLENFLNSLNGEIVAIIPNVDGGAGTGGSAGVDFLLIVEKLK